MPVSSFGLVPLKEIRRMLVECAPGARVKTKEHHYWVLYNGKTFRDLPKGEHGHANPGVQVGKFRSMMRFFGLNEDCVQKHITLQIS